MSLPRSGEDSSTDRRLSRRAVLGSTALAGATAAATSLIIQPQARAQVGAPLDWADPVLGHGAVTDGSADASAAINAAIADVRGAGGPDSGGVVHLQRGVFLIAQTVVLAAGVTLAGAGSGTVLRAAPGLLGPVVRVPTGSEQVVLSDLRIDAAQQTDPAGVGILIDAGGAGTRGAGPDTFVLVDRVTITGPPAAGIIVGQDTREARSHGEVPRLATGWFLLQARSWYIDGKSVGIGEAHSEQSHFLSQVLDLVRQGRDANRVMKAEQSQIEDAKEEQGGSGNHSTH